MRFEMLNWIMCTTRTTGTGAYTIDAASPSYLSFSLLSEGARVPYQTAWGSQREAAIGTKSGNTILRTNILQSTNGGAAVNWPSSASREIALTNLAQLRVYCTDGSITVNDDPVTGHTVIAGYKTSDLETWFAANVLGGVDVHIDGFTINALRTLVEDADAATITLGLADGSTREVTIAGNRQLRFEDELDGQSFTTVLKYDAVGGRVILWPDQSDPPTAVIEWATGRPPAFTPVGGGSDSFEFERIGTEDVDDVTLPKYRGWVVSRERPVILDGEAAADVTATITTMTPGVAKGPDELQWLTATIDSDYMDYSLTRTGTVSGGTFDLQIQLGEEESELIEDIPFDVTAFDLLTLIWENTTLTAGDINVDGGVAGADWDAQLTDVAALIHLEFIGEARYAGYVISIDSTNLTGGGSYSVDATDEGSGSQDWPFTGGATYTSKFMQFSYNGNSTGNIACDASAGTIQTAVANLAGIVAGNLTVTKHGVGVYGFQFVSDLRATNMGHEIQFTAGHLPSSDSGDATGQRYSTSRNGAGPQGTNEVQELTITGSPTEGTVVVTFFPGEAEEADVTIPVTATESESQALIDAAIGAGNVDVTGDLPDSPMEFEYIGDFEFTDVAEATVDDSGASSSAIDWYLCDGKRITLRTGDGRYSFLHRNTSEGQTVLVRLTSDEAAGDFEWAEESDRTFDWNGSPPDVPADGDSILLEFTRIGDVIHAKNWFGGSGAGGECDCLTVLSDSLEDGYRLRWDIEEDSLGTHFYPDVVMLDEAETYASEITIDLSRSRGDRHKFPLEGNATLRITNFSLGSDPERLGKLFRLVPVQDATGGRTIDFNGSSQTWLFPDGEPALCPIPGAEDELEFLVTSLEPPQFTFVRAIHRPRRIDLSLSANGGSAGNIEDLPSEPNITALWHHEESGSSDRVDAVNSLHFAATNGTITSVAGVRNQATQLADIGVLTCSDHSAISAGNIDFSIVFWLKDVSLTDIADNAIVAKTNATDGFSVRRKANGTMRFVLIVSSSAGIVDSTEAVDDGGWHLIVCVHDAAANLIKISVDGGAFHTSSWSSGGTDTTADLTIGTIGTTNGTFAIDELAFIKTALTSEDVDFLAGTLATPTNLDWRYEINYLTLSSESGDFAVGIGEALPSQTIRVAVENNGGTGTLTFEGVDTGDDDAPTLPADGKFDLFELTAIDGTHIACKTIQRGLTP